MSSHQTLLCDFIYINVDSLMERNFGGFAGFLSKLCGEKSRTTFPDLFRTLHSGKMYMLPRFHNCRL